MDLSHYINPNKYYFLNTNRKKNKKNVEVQRVLDMFIILIY